MLPTALCTADSRAHAEQIVQALQTAEVSAANISALVLPPDPKARPEPLQGLRYTGDDDKGKKAAGAAGAGGLAGAAAGVLAVGFAPILLMAPLLVAGGAALGGVAGAGAAFSGLKDYGIPQGGQEKYQKALTDGGWLVAVRTEDEAELERARQAFEQAGGKDVDVFRLTKRLA